MNMKKIIILTSPNDDSEIIIKNIKRQLNQEYDFYLYNDTYTLYKDNLFRQAHMIFSSYFIFQKDNNLLFFLEQLHIPLVLYYYRESKILSFYHINKLLNQDLILLAKNTNPYFILNTRDGDIKIHFNSILYLESNKMYVYIHTNQAKHRIRTQLNSIQESLPASFLRCHQSFIVNTAYVFSTKRTEIQLLNGLILPISKKYIKMVRDYFN